MRAAVVLVLASACGFRVDPGIAGGDARHDAPGDLGRDSPGDVPMTPGDGPPRVACDTPYGSNIVACYELEDDVTDGTLLDSGPAHLDASAMGLSAVMRAGGGAAMFTPSASVRTTDVPALDLAAGYTVAMWANPASSPVPGDVLGMLDHENQYAMLIGNASGEIQARCVHTGVTRYEWTTSPPTNKWSFFACTWDGANFCAYRFTSQSDHQHFCHHPTQNPAAGGDHGLAIGHLSDTGQPQFPFDGALDGIQIYNRQLTPAELCTLAGANNGNCLPCDTCS